MTKPGANQDDGHKNGVEDPGIVEGGTKSIESSVSLTHDIAVC